MFNATDLAFTELKPKHAGQALSFLQRNVTHSLYAKWFIAHSLAARQKLSTNIFNDMLFQSLKYDSNKFKSFVMTPPQQSKQLSQSQSVDNNVDRDRDRDSDSNHNNEHENDIFGFCYLTHHKLNKKHSINEQSLCYSFVHNLQKLKYILLPLNIGFQATIKLLLFYYNAYQCKKLVLQNLRQNYNSIIEIDLFAIDAHVRRRKYGTHFIQQVFQYVYAGYESYAFPMIRSPQQIRRDQNANANANRNRNENQRQSDESELQNQLLIEARMRNQTLKMIHPPLLYIECTQDALAFWKKNGFRQILSIKSAFFEQELMLYCLIYHCNENRLTYLTNQCTAIERIHRVSSSSSSDNNNNNDHYQQENSRSLNFFDLISINISDGGNNDFSWKFPWTNILEIIAYLIQFGWLSYIIQVFQFVINDVPYLEDIPQIIKTQKWKSIKLFVKICIAILSVILFFPFLIVLNVMRYFRICAWDTD